MYNTDTKQKCIRYVFREKYNVKKRCQDKNVNETYSEKSIVYNTDTKQKCIWHVCREKYNV